jgi:hypothetical protein
MDNLPAEERRRFGGIWQGSAGLVGLSEMYSKVDSSAKAAYDRDSEKTTNSLGHGKVGGCKQLTLSFQMRRQAVLVITSRLIHEPDGETLHVIVFPISMIIVMALYLVHFTSSYTISPLVCMVIVRTLY